MTSERRAGMDEAARIMDDLCNNGPAEGAYYFGLAACEIRAAAAALPDEPSGDWKDDASHENGNYQCQCVECGKFFLGHKRRVMCKLCATKDEPQGSAVEELRQAKWWVEGNSLALRHATRLLEAEGLLWSASLALMDGLSLKREIERFLND